MPLFTNAGTLPYRDYTGWTAVDTTDAIARWHDTVLRAQATYERFAVSLQTTSSAIRAYQQGWNNYTMTATSNATTYIQNWVVDYAATPESEARWRREKLELLRASKRARKTLMKFLDQEQLASYAATGRFKVVASNGWVFELRKQGNPLLLGDDGHADASFCIHPRERFPDEDTILSFMLLLMSDVEEFLRIANRTTIRQRAVTPVDPLAPVLAVPLAAPMVAAAA